NSSDLFNKGHRSCYDDLRSFNCWAWLPLLGWVIRNYIILGHGLPADIDFELSGQPTHFTVIEFLTVYPFFTQLFGTFFGIFGWYGSGQDLILTSFHLPLFYQFLYALLVTLLGTVSLWFLFLESKFFRKKSAVFSFVGGGLTSVAVYQFDLFSAESFFVSWILYLSLFSILFAVAFGSTRIWLTTKPCCDWRERIEFESILVCGFFLLILFFKLYNLSNEKGQLRGTHGRYFFSVLGFLLLAWIVPGLSKLSRGPLLALPLALLMTAAEYCIWVGEVIPFFESR
ncbi:MAG: hypothetical protein O3C20_23895, partial [Verrucomicrobia bacterium]|nr:hypothetical protein [Verrucomicrobiota bacterium]